MLSKDFFSPTKLILVQYIKTPQGCLPEQWKHSTFYVRFFPVPYAKQHLQTSVRVAHFDSIYTFLNTKNTVLMLVRLVGGYHLLQLLTTLR